MTLWIKLHDGPGSLTEIRAGALLARSSRAKRAVTTEPTESYHTNGFKVVRLVMMLVLLVSVGWS